MQKAPVGPHTATGNGGKTLRPAAGLLCAALHASRDGYLLFRPADGGVVDVNDAMLERVGRTREEVVDADAASLELWGEQAAQGQQHDQPRERRFAPVRELAVRDQSGGVRRGVISSEKVDIGGEPYGLVVWRDLPESALSDRRWREAEKIFTSVLRTCREGFILLRLPDEMILEVNDGWLNITGFARDDVIGKTTSQLNLWAKAEDRERFAVAMRERGAVSDFQFTYRNKSGELRAASFSAELVTLGGETCALIIGRDVTEQRQEREALRDSERRFRSLVTATSQIVWTTNAEGGETSARNWEETTGHSVAEAVNWGWLEALHPDDREATRRARVEAYEKKELYQAEFRLRHADGSYRHYLARAAPVLDDEGRVCEWVGALTDITERKRAERQIVESSEQLRSLTARLQAVREEESARIARELHDELGQKLTAIILDLSWLEERWFDEEGVRDRQEVLAKIRAASKLAGSTVQTVRRVATELRPGLLDDFGITAATEWLAQKFHQRTGVRCEVKAKLNRADLPAQISTAVFRICQEALTNAARHARASNVCVTLDEVGGCVRLEVKDDGRGATAAELSDARALGVMGMRERALLLGGEARVTGTQGQGTTVSVSIPLPPENQDGSSG